MYIKRPRADRRSYAIVGKDGKTIKDPRIDKINEDLHKGVARDLLELRLEEVLNSLKPKVIQVPLAHVNALLVEDCHRKKSRKRPLADPQQMLSRLMSCARAVGNVSIAEATEDQLYEAIDYIKDPSRRFEVIRGINELLIFSKRPFTLFNIKVKKSKRVGYIELPNFQRKVLELKETEQAVFGTLFAIGCRWGELPVARFFEKTAYITEQLDKKGVIRGRKNSSESAPPYVIELIKYINHYRNLPQEQKNDIRLNQYNRYYRLSKTMFGIRLHDFRHSYAIQKRKEGYLTSQIAKFIGDTEQACKDHYLNHGLTEEEIVRTVLQGIKLA
jgi:hypothetical protein